MPGFTIAPVSIAATEDTGFPNFIQFQQDGVNLGGPDADTVDFGTGLTATRGTGENENRVTVVAESSPSSSTPLLVARLDPLSNGNLGTYAYAPFTDWSGTVLASTTSNISWDQETQSVLLTEAGVYSVDFQAHLTDNDRQVFDFSDMAGNVIYGTEVSEAVSITLSEHYTGENQGTSSLPTNTVAWADRYIVVVVDEDLPLSFQPKVYGGQYHAGPPGDSITCSAVVTVTKVA